MPLKDFAGFLSNQLEWKWCTLRYAHFVWTGWIVVAGKRSCIYCTWLAKKKNSRDPSEQNKMYSIDKMFFWNKKKKVTLWHDSGYMNISVSFRA